MYPPTRIPLHFTLLSWKHFIYYEWNNLFENNWWKKTAMNRGDTHITECCCSDMCIPCTQSDAEFLSVCPNKFLLECSLTAMSLCCRSDKNSLHFLLHASRIFFWVMSFDRLWGPGCLALSVLCIPTGDTHITSDMCVGIHISRGYTYHCDTATWLYSLRPKIVSSWSGKCDAANAIFSGACGVCCRVDEIAKPNWNKDIFTGT